MTNNKWWQFVLSLRLEFWLLLPLLGLIFWIASGLFTEHSLNQSNRTIEPLSIIPDTTEPDSTVLVIKVTVDRHRNLSRVKVKQATQIYQKQEFELATTQLKQVEAAIAKKIDLSPEKVRQLLRYQFK